MRSAVSLSAKEYPVAYPGGDSSTTDAQINQYIDTACETPFQIYVGVSINDTEELNYGWFYPSESEAAPLQAACSLLRRWPRHPQHRSSRHERTP